ncbi:MAG: hypothetical protein WKH64_02860 [Chloroflexia bacterium]
MSKAVEEATRAHPSARAVKLEWTSTGAPVFIDADSSDPTTCAACSPVAR